MKKVLLTFLAIILVVASVLTLTACGSFNVNNINWKFWEHKQTQDDNTDDGNTHQVIPPKPTSTFATDDWATISANSASGLAGNYYNIGDEKGILIGDTLYIFQILGFNHDDLVSGGKAGITLGMKGLYDTKYRMNATDTTNGGWNASQMRTQTLPNIFETLPSELKSVIKLVNKSAVTSTSNRNITVSQDKLFLFCRNEIIGDNDPQYVNEGSQYEYWVGKSDDDKIKQNPNGTFKQYWLRSAHHIWEEFCTIQDYGQWYLQTPTSLYGVCFGFCV